MKPHAVLIPYPAQGHIAPVLKLAKLLHSKGFFITFVHTEFNYNRLVRSRGPESVSGLEDFQFKTIPDGLPVSDKDATQDIPQLCDSLRRNGSGPFLDLVNGLNDSPDCPNVSCIVSDGVMSFTLDASEKLRIPEVVFFTTSACGFMGYCNYAELVTRGIFPLQDESQITNGYLETELDWVAGMRNIRLRDFPSFVRTTDPDDIMVNYNILQTKDAARAQAVLINTFDDLEKEVLDALRRKFGQVLTIGPLQLLERQFSSPAESIGSASLWKEDDACIAPRATPEMWPDLISKSKEGGVDVIETYVFWNGHEPAKGQYVFEGRYDLVKFVKQVGSNGLYLFLRIGPYVCAEWNFGGFPVWLRDIPGIEFRTDNKPFKEEMQRFVKKIVDLMREESLFSWQGGPIIMLQIENEYGNIESSYGSKGKDYMRWAAEMAVGLGAGVPWVMCKQVDAPEYIIDSCNGYYCDGFKPNSNKKPTLWTENWDGWYTSWGDRVPQRPSEDIAFAVARFYQRGGSFQNYYMYFGGTNFGRSSGGPNYITSYDYDAPIDEYGLLRQPKWGHLKDLHAAIKLCEPALVAVLSPQYIKLGPNQEAHVYRDDGSKCSAFLANIDEHNSATVKFLNQAYVLPPWSVSILPDCKNVAFNTAKIGAQTSIKNDGFDVISYLSNPSNMKLIGPDAVGYISKNWSFVKEPVGVWGDKNFTYQGILEHLNVTKDQSDYLWYTTRIYISDKDVTFWEENQVSPVLSIDSMRDLVYIFVNGQFQGSAKGKWIKVAQSVDLIQGYNDITLLSQTVGLQNYGAFLEKDGAGFRGQVKLNGLKNGDLNITEHTWTYQVGLKGESLKIHATGASTEWTELPLDSVATRFSWYKTYFDVSSGLDPVALDLSSMGKGQVWVNGHHIGRYWTLNAPKDGCPTCDYRGSYNSDKCVTNCGHPTQSWYHIPRSWLHVSNNLLVIFEEAEKNPFEILIKSHYTETICAQVSENHYPPLHAWSQPKSSNGTISLNYTTAPEMGLRCDAGNTISSVTFASYGTPQGSCQSFSRGNCHAANSFSVVSQACLGKQSCSISVSNTAFGGDPCHGVVKNLSVKMKCSPSSSSSTGLVASEMVASSFISSF